MKGLLRAFAIGFMFTATLAGCGKPAPLRLGYIGELTGNSADLGEAGRNGVMLAVEQWNAEGGLRGQRIELLARNTGSTPEAARKAAEELLASDVAAVVGAMTSSMTEAIVPLFDKAGVVLISPTSSAVKLFGRDDQLIRINWTTRDNAQLYARHAQQAGYKRIAIAVNANNRTFSESWLNDFRATFEQAGGKIVAAPYFDSNAESLDDVIKAMLDGQPDALLFIANAGDSARLAQQTRKLNERIPLLACEWAGTEQLIELGGKSVDGLAMLMQFDADDTSPAYLAFRERYLKRFGRPPPFGSVLAHDATTVVLDAITRRTNDMPLKTAILRLGPFQGLQESIQFDTNGDTRRRAAIAIVRDQRYVRTP